MIDCIFALSHFSVKFVAVDKKEPSGGVPEGEWEDALRYLLLLLACRFRAATIARTAA